MRSVQLLSPPPVYLDKLNRQLLRSLDSVNNNNKSPPLDLVDLEARQQLEVREVSKVDTVFKNYYLLFTFFTLYFLYSLLFTLYTFLFTLIFTLFTLHSLLFTIYFTLFTI